MQHKLPVLASHKENLATLCQKYQVEKLYLFGSALTDRFAADSDLDIVVQFQPLDCPPEDQGQLYWDFLASLEQLFDRSVDLLTDKKFSNPYFQQEVNRTKTLIYDRSQSAEVLI